MLSTPFIYHADSHLISHLFTSLLIKCLCKYMGNHPPSLSPWQLPSHLVTINKESSSSNQKGLTLNDDPFLSFCLCLLLLLFVGIHTSLFLTIYTHSLVTLLDKHCKHWVGPTFGFRRTLFLCGTDIWVFSHGVVSFGISHQSCYKAGVSNSRPRELLSCSF